VEGAAAAADAAAGQLAAAAADAFTSLGSAVESHVRDVDRAGEPVPAVRPHAPPSFSRALAVTPSDDEVLSGSGAAPYPPPSTLSIRENPAVGAEGVGFEPEQMEAVHGGYTHTTGKQSGESKEGGEEEGEEDNEEESEAVAMEVAPAEAESGSPGANKRKAESAPEASRAARKPSTITARRPGFSSKMAAPAPAPGGGRPEVRPGALKDIN
jgi:hypothetical protein